MRWLIVVCLLGLSACSTVAPPPVETVSSEYPLLWTPYERRVWFGL